MSEDVRRMQEAAERQTRQTLLQAQQQAEIQRQQKAAQAARSLKGVKQIEARYIVTGAERVGQPASPEITKATEAAAATVTAKTVQAATQIITQAQQALTQAEALSESWGAKIQWGDKTYDLSTTKGWKDYKQAIRDAKSDLTKAAAAVERYELDRWKEATSKKTAKIVKDANRVIEQANKIIEQQNIEAQKIAEANRKLIEAKFTHDIKPKTQAEYYKEQVDDIYGQLTALVLNDVIDKKQAEDAIRQATPAYLATARTENEFEKWMAELDRLTKDAEKRAEWKAQKGVAYKDRMKPENRPTPAQLAARLEHIALSMTGGAVRATPYIVLGAAGGPLTSGLVMASSVARFVDLSLIHI